MIFPISFIVFPTVIVFIRKGLFKQGEKVLIILLLCIMMLKKR